MARYDDLEVTPRVSARDAVAVIGVGAVLPDAPDAATFWSNVLASRSSVGEVPPSRWNVKDYYDPDPSAPDKTYCRIGAFVRDFVFDAVRFKIPPKVADAMDMVQKWAIAATREALADAGCLDRDAGRERTAVILGNAVPEEWLNKNNLRVNLPLYINPLLEDEGFRALPEEKRRSLVEAIAASIRKISPPITEDTMPGELSNVITGRVANVFNLKGANFTTDAACASSFAALSAACGGLRRGEFDMAVAGGVDRSMSPATFIKFCKIGALSAEGSFPFDERASGFVMGEGCACFVLKRYSDALRDGDRVYGVITAIGTSSDGRGKGITAPNVEGQVLALRRAYEAAGVDPRTVDMVEAHGTATRVGDAVEAEALGRFMNGRDPARPVRMTSVKSQIGHLKGAAGAASLLKASLALHHKIFPASINLRTPSPAIDWSAWRLRVQTACEPWERRGSGPRTAGLSSFGFGGTNFHVVMQEALEPGTMTRRAGKRRPPGEEAGDGAGDGASLMMAVGLIDEPGQRPVLAGAGNRKSTGGHGEGPRDGKEREMENHDIVIDMLDRVRFMGGRSLEDLVKALLGGERPRRLSSLDEASRLAEEPWRLAVAGEGDAALEERTAKLLAAASKGIDEKKLPFLRRQGVYLAGRASGAAGFLYPGQGSQSINMLATLRARYAAFREVLERADAVMQPLLGHTLSSIVYADVPEGSPERAAMEERLQQTDVTQPAMMAVDHAMTLLLERMGLRPDFVTGHSLGEYGALVAAGVLGFEDSLEIVAARGREMSSVSIEDPGRMFAAMADLETTERLLGKIDGYLLPANKNSRKQTVVAGSTDAVTKAMEIFEAEGVRTVPLRVSHAFHSKIVAGAIEPLRKVLSRYDFQKPRVPVFGNVTGRAYPMDASKEHFIDMLGRQIASPVEFIRCLEGMHEAGAGFFVEVGPRRVLASFAEDVLPGDVTVACSNNHRQGDLESLAHLFAAAAVAGALRPADRPARGIPAGNGGSRNPGAGSGGDRKARAPENLLAEVLELVSGKTGYPVDMLDPAMDMEADLGIDTVKQAELFSIIRKTYGIPRQENIKLKDYPTINHVVGFISKFVEAPAVVEAPAIVEAPAAPPAPAAPAIGREALLGQVLELLSQKTGYPVDMLDPGMDMEADLGIDTVKQAELFSVIRKTYGIPRQENIKLKDYPTINHVVDFVARFVTAPEAAEVPATPPAPEKLEEPGKLPDRAVEAEPARPAPAAAGGGIRVVISGTSLGLPGRERPVFGDGNFEDIYQGKNFIDEVPGELQEKLVGMNMTRIDKGTGDDLVQTQVQDTADVIKLAGQMGGLDLAGDYGVDGELASTMDDTARLAAAAGLEALRDAGIPLVLEKRRTTTGAEIPVGWRLPPSMRDETGVIFASAFPGYNRFASELERYFRSRHLGGAYEFDRKILFGILAMGHTQFAQLIGARGPNVQVNAACASTLVAAATAVDWIRAGRCRRVIVISADNTTSPELLPWVGGGFLVNGGAATDGNVKDAAMPFDRRRHGLLLGMGAAAALLEAEDEVRGRGMNALAGIVSTKITNSAYHGTRLDPEHIARTLRAFAADCAAALGIGMDGLARNLVFLSHETYTPARGGSATAEVRALRETFGERLGGILIANTKGFTGHPMGVGFEESVAPRILFDQRVPPVANVESIETEFEDLNLSRGGSCRADRVLRFSAGFGSQVAMALLEKDGGPGPRIVDEALHRAWLEAMAGAPGASLAVAGRVLRLEAAAKPAAGKTPAPEKKPAAVEEVRRKVIALISEKTGYPPDMLDPDMDMEADLGIDTVKQAELFSVIRKTFGIPKVEAIRLKDYPTIRHVVRFIAERASDMAASVTGETAAAPSEPDEEAHVETPVDESLLETVEAFKARITRPTARWLPPASHFPPTGIALRPGDAVVIHGRSHLRQELERRLVELGAKAIDAETTPAAAVGSPVRGIVFFEDTRFQRVPSLEDLPFHCELVVNEAVARLEVLQNVVATGAFDDSNGFVLGVTAGAAAPGGAGQEAGISAGALTGFIKALAFELAGCVVKAVDVEPGCDPEQTAALLVSEILHDRGSREVGILRGTRWMLELESVEMPGPGTEGEPGGRRVYLVTGAGGSVMGDAVRKIAFMEKADFILLDVVKPAVTRSGRWSRSFGRIMSLVEYIERRGGSALAITADVTDPRSVGRAVKSALVRYGRIDVVIHGAGIEKSRSVLKKSKEEFRRVVAIKVQGAGNLLSAVMGRCRPSMVVFFSSVAGRFGNAGQADYSAGNDFMARLAARCAGLYPDVRMLAVDWTAWDGEGMAGNESIRAVLEEAGVEMLARKEGLDILWRLIQARLEAPELVVSGKLGMLEESFNRSARVSADGVAGERDTADGSGLLRRITVAPASEMYLWDHAVDGTPVFPAVKGLELFHQASLPMVGEGWRLVGIRDAGFHRAVKFFSGRARDVLVRSSLGYSGSFIESRCSLQTEGRGMDTGLTTNFEAKLLFDVVQDEEDGSGADFLVTRSDGVDMAGGGWDEGTSLGSEDIYRFLFHKNQFRVVESFCLAGGREDCGLGRMAVAPRANLSGIYMLVEFGMQSAGLYLMRTAGAAALPSRIASVNVLGAIDDRRPYRAIAMYRGMRTSNEAEHYAFDVSVRDPSGSPVLWMGGLELVRTDSVPEARLAPRMLPALEAIRPARV